MGALEVGWGEWVQSVMRANFRARGPNLFQRVIVAVLREDRGYEERNLCRLRLESIGCSLHGRLRACPGASVLRFAFVFQTPSGHGEARMGTLHLMQDEVDRCTEPARRGQLGGSTVTAFTSGLDADGYEVCTVSLSPLPRVRRAFQLISGVRCPLRSGGPCQDYQPLMLLRHVLPQMLI